MATQHGRGDKLGHDDRALASERASRSARAETIRNPWAYALILSERPYRSADAWVLFGYIGSTRPDIGTRRGRPGRTFVGACVVVGHRKLLEGTRRTTVGRNHCGWSRGTGLTASTVFFAQGKPRTLMYFALVHVPLCGPTKNTCCVRFSA